MDEREYADEIYDYYVKQFNWIRSLLDPSKDVDLRLIKYMRHLYDVYDMSRIRAFVDRFLANLKYGVEPDIVDLITPPLSPVVGVKRKKIPINPGPHGYLPPHLMEMFDADDAAEIESDELLSGILPIDPYRGYVDSANASLRLFHGEPWDGVASKLASRNIPVTNRNVNLYRSFISGLIRYPF